MGVFTRSRSGRIAGPANLRAGLELDKPGAGLAAGGRLISFNVTPLELAHVPEPVGAGRLF